MKIKKVNRYYCDYCKKSGCNAYWIRKHEERCTLNPHRKCGYCHILEQDQSNLADLLIILPNPMKYLKEDKLGVWYIGLEHAVDEILPKLREQAGNCPACIMAALRQKGIPVPIARNFHFSEECTKAWDEFNKARCGAEWPY